MDKVIEVRVRGSHLIRNSQTAGVQHEGNAAVLRMDFDPGWDGFAKTVTFWNARGENPVKRVLTTELLEELSRSTRIYRCPIPPEAMAEAGWLTYVIDGAQEGARRRSVEDRLKVLPAAHAPEAGESADPTPTQAEQLQVQVDAIVRDVHGAAENASAAAVSAAAAARSETCAAESEAASRQAAASAAESEEAAKKAAALCEASVSGVATFNGRGGHVAPRSGDYTADMVGAAPKEHSHTAAEVGARPDAWLPTAAEVGAVPITETAVPAGEAASFSFPNPDSYALVVVRGWAVGAECAFLFNGYTGGGPTYSKLLPLSGSNAYGQYISYGINKIAEGYSGHGFTVQNNTVSGISVRVIRLQGEHAPVVEMTAENAVSLECFTAHPVSGGGTGANDAANARVNLGITGSTGDIVLHTGNVVASAADIAAGSSAGWRQYLVYQ